MGNLDPGVLMGSKKTIDEKTAKMITSGKKCKRFVAGVGQGIFEEIDPKNVEIFMEAIKNGMADTAKYKREINQAYGKLSGVLLENKSFKELEKIGKQWTEFDPNYAFAWLYLGIAYQGQADKENACRCYKKGAAIDKENQFFKKSLKTLECN